MKTNMKFLVDSGIDGCFAQNTGHGRPGGLVPLQSWLWAKLAWNPDFDVEKGMDDFIKGYYGPAAEPVKQYVNLLLENVPQWGTDQMKYKKEHGCPYWLRPELITRYDELFDSAENLAQADKNLLLRVKTTRLGIPYHKLQTLKPDEPERKKIMEKFFDTCDKAGISEVVYVLQTNKSRIKHATPADYRKYLEQQTKEK